VTAASISHDKYLKVDLRILFLPVYFLGFF